MSASRMTLLYPVDREALRALYGRLGPGDAPTDFGSWGDTSTHIHGNGEHAGYGVALRNGYAEPVRLRLRAVALPDASRQRRRRGRHVARQPRGPDARRRSCARGRAGERHPGHDDRRRPTSRRWRRGERASCPVPPVPVTQWGDGDLRYAIAVHGGEITAGRAGHTAYTFRETGGDAGRLTGTFTGQNHEGVAGTLERSDLTAAFGGSR